MDVLTADGEVITASPDGPHADLYRGLRQLLRNPGLRAAAGHRPAPGAALRPARAPPGGLGRPHRGDHRGLRRRERRLRRRHRVRGRRAVPDDRPFTDDPGPGTSDYTGQQIFYRSIRERTVDHLTIHDYLWRWDTDWFWCSRVFGVQHPAVRRLWPRRYRRSDVYRRLVALDRRTGLSGRVRRLARLPQEEPVIQDVEIPVEPARRVPGRVPPRHRDHPGLAVPAAAAQRPALAALPDASGGALRQRRLLVGGAGDPR